VFSPDGQWIAFFASNKLNKVPVTGGAVVSIADVNDPRGLTWDVPEVITYTPESIGGISEVAPAAGAAPKPLTTLPKGSAERTHRWPERLPNGVIIFTVGSVASPDNYDNATIEAVLPSGERKVLITGAAMARYVPGYLVFVRGGALFAVSFNLDRVEASGTPVSLGYTVAGDSTTGASNFEYAAGTFAYVPGAAEATHHRLAWMDHTGASSPSTCRRRCISTCRCRRTAAVPR
jgi:serine/threonine-protein kinase